MDALVLTGRIESECGICVQGGFKGSSFRARFVQAKAKAPGKSTPASTTAQAPAALELKVKIYCGAPIIEASHSDFEDPIKSQINLARYREILEDWIEFDNQAIAWKISKLPVVPHVNSYQTNKPPGKTASLICYGAEPQLARVLQSARAMASITRLCADAPASGKYSRVTPDVLKEVRSAAEAIDQILALLQPKFPSPSRADPFFEIYASWKIAKFCGLREFGAPAAPRNRELLQGPTPRAG